MATSTSTPSRRPTGISDLLVINTNPAASLTDQFNVTGFQPGTSAQVWQYGETQDTAQSQTANGASALANSTATLNVSGSSFSYTFPAYSMTVLDLTPPPVVTPSGSPANYTAGGPAVAVDGGITVSSVDSQLTRRHDRDLGRHAAIGRHAQFHQYLRRSPAALTRQTAL